MMVAELASNTNPNGDRKGGNLLTQVDRHDYSPIQNYPIAELEAATTPTAMKIIEYGYIVFDCMHPAHFDRDMIDEKLQGTLLD